jgi:acyl-CoA dehydrogenase
MLMTMRSQIEAMRALSFITAAAMDKAERHPDAAQRKFWQARVDLLIPVVKAWCTEQANEIASLGVQVHGGMGFIEETGAAQYLRDARITTIYEGTTGIQANDLMGRKLARDKGEAAIALLKEMQQTVVAAMADPVTASLGKDLAQALGQLQTASEWVLHNFATDTAGTMLSAAHYLKLFGTVAGGWALVKSAVVAQAKLTAGEGDASFYKQKIATARFYADQILPLTASLLVMTQRGSSSLQAADGALL